MAESTEHNPTGIDCAICLEEAVYPVKLPCSHCFCYLCLKGTALTATQHGQNPRCSICRTGIPLQILTNPPLMGSVSNNPTAASGNEYQWFYESRSGGWWQFEQRHNVDLERAFEAKEPKCKLLVVGQLFEIDFQQMIQYRPNSRHIIRRIKRDLVTAQKKGIAGIRINSTPDSSTPVTQGIVTNATQDPPVASASATALLGPSEIRAVTARSVSSSEVDEYFEEDDGDDGSYFGSDMSGDEDQEEDDDDSDGGDVVIVDFFPPPPQTRDSSSQVEAEIETVEDSTHEEVGTTLQQMINRVESEAVSEVTFGDAVPIPHFTAGRFLSQMNNREATLNSNSESNRFLVLRRPNARSVSEPAGLVYVHDFTTPSSSNSVESAVAVSGIGEDGAEDTTGDNNVLPEEEMDIAD